MAYPLHRAFARLSLRLPIVAIVLGIAGALPFAPEAAAQETAKGQAQVAASASLRKAAGGNPHVVEIVSDSLGETEFRIADEIATAVASTQEAGPNGEFALRVTPVVSRGGIQAIRDVLTLPNADFGIVATRVLDRVRATGELGDIRDRLTYVTPLYVEEVHLVAGANVHSLTDLQGQAVSIGKDESTTQVIAREILATAGIRVREERFDLREAIVPLKAGDIAAAFLVSGKPVDGLKVLAPADGLHLVPISLLSPASGFLPSTITADDYPELLRPGERVSTVAVQTVLFAYNWPSKSPRTRLGELFINSLFWRLETLQRPPHHSKWQEVNLAGTLPGWRRLAAMEAWLKKAASRQEEQSLKAEFEQFLTERGLQAGTRDRESLFRAFLQWRNTPSTTGSR